MLETYLLKLTIKKCQAELLDSCLSFVQNFKDFIEALEIGIAINTVSWFQTIHILHNFDLLDWRLGKKSYCSNNYDSNLVVKMILNRDEITIHLKY